MSLPTPVQSIELNVDCQRGIARWLAEDGTFLSTSPSPYVWKYCFNENQTLVHAVYIFNVVQHTYLNIIVVWITCSCINDFKCSTSTTCYEQSSVFCCFFARQLCRVIISFNSRKGCAVHTSSLCGVFIYPSWSTDWTFQDIFDWDWK